MRKIIYIISIILLSFSIYVNGQKNTLINGNWNIDSVQYVELDQFVPSETTKGAFFNFKKDGSYQLFNTLKHFTGTWIVNNDTIKITTQDEKLIFVIDDLNKNFMIISTHADDTTTLRFYLTRNDN